MANYKQILQIEKCAGINNRVEIKKMHFEVSDMNARMSNPESYIPHMKCVFE